MVQGIGGVIGAYKSTLPYIALSGPTYFGPILTEFKNFCTSAGGKKQYNILLLLTDGVIHDMPMAKQLCVDLSAMPCSIIIIGVGAADFSAMRELDGDGPGMLRDNSGRQV